MLVLSLPQVKEGESSTLSAANYTTLIFIRSLLNPWRLALQNIGTVLPEQ